LLPGILLIGFTPGPILLIIGTRKRILHKKNISRLPSEKKRIIVYEEIPNEEFEWLKNNNWRYLLYGLVISLILLIISIITQMLSHLNLNFQFLILFSVSITGILTFGPLFLVESFKSQKAIGLNKNGIAVAHVLPRWASGFIYLRWSDIKYMERTPNTVIVRFTLINDQQRQLYIPDKIYNRIHDEFRGRSKEIDPLRKIPAKDISNVRWKELGPLMKPYLQLPFIGTFSTLFFILFRVLIVTFSQMSYLIFGLLSLLLSILFMWALMKYIKKKRNLERIGMDLKGFYLERLKGKGLDRIEFHTFDKMRSIYPNNGSINIIGVDGDVISHSYMKEDVIEWLCSNMSNQYGTIDESIESIPVGDISWTINTVRKKIIKSVYGYVSFIIFFSVSLPLMFFGSHISLNMMFIGMGLFLLGIFSIISLMIFGYPNTGFMYRKIPTSVGISKAGIHIDYGKRRRRLHQFPKLYSWKDIAEIEPNHNFSIREIKSPPGTSLLITKKSKLGYVLFYLDDNCYKTLMKGWKERAGAEKENDRS